MKSKKWFEKGSGKACSEMEYERKVWTSGNSDAVSSFGPYDVFCAKCGCYHSSMTFCPERPITQVPICLDAVREAMDWADDSDNFAYDYTLIERMNIKTLAAYVRELEAERDRLKAELAEAKGEKGVGT